MKRRDFLKTTAAAGALALINGRALKGEKVFKQKDITYKTLPLWKGFNLQEKFTHKPDEWLDIAPEWGAKNEPFRESDFAAIRELRFNYVRLPMSYKCWCEEDDWYKLKEKHLKEIAQCAIGYTPGVVTHYKAAWSSGNDTFRTWPMKDNNGELWERSRLVEHFQPWKDIKARGIGVYVGEFGVYNQTPHVVTLAFLKDNLEIWKQNKWGYAMWCFRGSFGVADSGRSDVKYENYKGMKLDRKMVELLKVN